MILLVHIALGDVKASLLHDLGLNPNSHVSLDEELTTLWLEGALLPGRVQTGHPTLCYAYFDRPTLFPQQRQSCLEGVWNVRKEVMFGRGLTDRPHKLGHRVLVGTAAEPYDKGGD